MSFPGKAYVWVVSMIVMVAIGLSPDSVPQEWWSRWAPRSTHTFSWAERVRNGVIGAEVLATPVVYHYGETYLSKLQVPSAAQNQVAVSTSTKRPNHLLLVLFALPLGIPFLLLLGRSLFTAFRPVLRQEKRHPLWAICTSTSEFIDGHESHSKEKEEEEEVGAASLGKRLIKLGLRPRTPESDDEDWDFDFVPSSQVSPTGPSVKTLLFHYSPDVDILRPLVVVVSATDSVHIRSVAQLLTCNAQGNAPDVMMMDVMSAEKHAGFRVGRIPPIGHTYPAKLLLDIAFISALPRNALIYGGSGEHGVSLCLRLGALLDQPWVHPAQVSRRSLSLLRAPSNLIADWQNLQSTMPHHVANGATIAPSANSSQPVTLPLLPFDPDVAEVCHIVAVIASKRRMARALAFCNAIPPPGPGDSWLSLVSPDNYLCWRRQDGAAVGVQFLFGRTLQEHVGREAAADYIRSLKPGHLVYVYGRVNYRRNDASKLNLLERNTYDIAVIDFQLLGMFSGSPTFPPQVPGLQVALSGPTSPQPLVSDDAPRQQDTVKKEYATLTMQDMGNIPVTIIGDIESLSLLSTLAQGTGNDTILVGMDCEWRPGKHTPVALLQLAFPSGVALVDLQALCNPQVTAVPLSATEEAVDMVLSSLFQNPKLLFIGYGIRGDFRRMAASYPHMGCFHVCPHTIELTKVIKHVTKAPLSSGTLLLKDHGRGLAGLCEVVLHRRLDKTFQCSQWDQRPLADAQVEYAALDAAVLPVLLTKMMGHLVTDWCSLPYGLVTEWRATGHQLEPHTVETGKVTGE